MIKKLEITNMGRLKSVKTDGDEQYFKRNTFIYGKNTYGKSTLTAIFRSLKENNPDFIVGRKTINSQKQLVKVTFDDGSEYRYSTDEKVWNNHYKNIAIFDNYFVRENIYTRNQQIGHEQQKDIEAFMLGTKGAKYNIDIEKLAEQIKENSKTQILINAEYSRNKHLLGGLDFKSFLLLKQVDDADQEVKKEQKKLNRIKNAELISQKLKDLRDLLKKYENFDISKIDRNLTVNSEPITFHFEKYINQKESKSSYGTFLQIGSKLRVRSTIEYCPFCTQEIKLDTAQKFIDAIDSIYNESYKNLNVNLKEATSLFSDTDFLQRIEILKKDFKQVDYEIDIDFSLVESHIKNCQQSILDKKENLQKDLDKSSFTILLKNLTILITDIGIKLTEFEKPVEKKDAIEQTIRNLLANKNRHGSWKDRCKKYSTAQSQNEKLGVQKSTLWKEYLNYASSLSDTMLKDMNAFLSACNCSFIVKQFSFQGNKRQDLLVLSLEGHKISNDGNDSAMTIKNSLSTSDKWILALAFFLTTVKNDNEVKIVIMDDPVSSFDSDRKRIILKELEKAFIKTDKQLVLLTHEKGFFRLLNFELKNNPSVVFLQLIFDNIQGSNFAVCNPIEDPEFMNDYNCWIADMKKSLESSDLALIKKAHSKIRHVIEHNLKVKFPLELTTNEKTIKEMLEKLEKSGGSYEQTTPRSEIVGLLPNIDHHDNSGNKQYPLEELGLEDYRKNIKDMFDILKIL